MSAAWQREFATEKIGPLDGEKERKENVDKEGFENASERLGFEL